MSKERLVKLIEQCVIDNDMPSSEQLATYLLASGEVLVQPCKVGDKVYHIHGTRVCEGIVESIHQNLVGKEQGRWIVTVWFDDYYANSKEAGFECGTHLFFPFDCFEKDVFRKREKAEAKLRKEDEEK